VLARVLAGAVLGIDAYLVTIGFYVPPKRITVNLAPA
jgi:hypothetical protein